MRRSGKVGPDKVLMTFDSVASSTGTIPKSNIDCSGPFQSSARLGGDDLRGLGRRHPFENLPARFDLSLHELFQKQTRQILDRPDLEEEQKQHILVAVSCPCCGAGVISFT